MDTRLREQSEMQKVVRGRVRQRIIALTANAFAADDRSCADAGMDGVLNKPMPISALRAVLTKGASRQFNECPVVIARSNA